MFAEPFNELFPHVEHEPAFAAFFVPFTVALPMCLAASAVSLPASLVASPAFFVSSLAPWAYPTVPDAQSVAMASAEMNLRMMDFSSTTGRIKRRSKGGGAQVAGGRREERAGCWGDIPS